MGIGEFALGVITGLVANTIDHTVSYGALEFFQRRKIERRVEDAVAEVVEPLLPFLANEHIEEYQQELLIQTCVNELQPLAENPEKLFQASLNGQKIFENLYAERDLPREVTDEGLKDIYILLFPRIATLLCKIPVAVKDWENESWTESYRRLDEITAELKALFKKVDNLANDAAIEADELLQTVRRTLAQKVAIELDLTGLRSDKPLSGKFDDFFVNPKIIRSYRAGEIIDASSKDYIGEEIFSEITALLKRATTVGVAGAGKSTWSKYLQRKAFSKDWQGVAIRVELRNFAQGELISYHQLIRETVGKHLAEEITAEKTRQWIEKQQIIFILDGFDEIPPEKRDAVRQWIKDLDVAVKNCSIIVTSRPLTTEHLDNLGRRWTPWNIEPFDKNRIIDYINRWYKYTSLLPDSDRQVDAQALASQWQSDPTIKPLTSNPLLLSTLLMVHHLDGSLPSGRSELYNRYVKGMLGLWDDRRKVSAHKTSLTLNQKWQILRGIAIYMHFQEKDQLDDGEISQQLNKILSKMKLNCSPEDVLETLRERSGLIIGPGIYSFIHKSVGEYLVAEAIIQGDQRDESGKKIDRLTLFDHRNDDRWNSIIFLWAGLAPVQDLEAFIDSCIDTQSYLLAYGLLYDQYEKISVETRIQLVKQLLQKNCNIAFDPHANGWWLYHQSYKKISDRKNRLEIPALILRGINNDAYLYKLFNLSVNKHSEVSWLDIENPQEEIRDLFWMISTRANSDINIWQKCLSSSFPKNGHKKEWLSWIAESNLRVILYNGKEEKILKTIKAYENSFPEYASLIYIYIIFTIVQFSENFSDRDYSFASNINCLLNVLFAKNLHEIKHEFLEDTKAWVRFDCSKKEFEELLEEDLDLLLKFKRSIAKLHEIRIIKSNKKCLEILDFANDLISIRDNYQSHYSENKI